MMKIRLKLSEVMAFVLGEGKNIPFGYVKEVGKIEKSLKSGKWTIAGS